MKKRHIMIQRIPLAVVQSRLSSALREKRTLLNGEQPIGEDNIKAFNARIEKIDGYIKYLLREVDKLKVPHRCALPLKQQRKLGLQPILS